MIHNPPNPVSDSIFGHLPNFPRADSPGPPAPLPSLHRVSELHLHLPSDHIHDWHAASSPFQNHQLPAAAELHSIASRHTSDYEPSSPSRGTSDPSLSSDSPAPRKRPRLRRGVDGIPRFPSIPPPKRGETDLDSPKRRIGRPLAPPLDPTDPTAARRERRRTANRESAKRMRIKRKSELEDLHEEYRMLTGREVPGRSESSPSQSPERGKRKPVLPNAELSAKERRKQTNRLSAQRVRDRRAADVRHLWKHVEEARREQQRRVFGGRGDGEGTVAGAGREGGGRWVAGQLSTRSRPRRADPKDHAAGAGAAEAKAPVGPSKVPFFQRAASPSIFPPSKQRADPLQHQRSSLPFTLPLLTHQRTPSPAPNAPPKTMQLHHDPRASSVKLRLSKASSGKGPIDLDAYPPIESQKSGEHEGNVVRTGVPVSPPHRPHLTTTGGNVVTGLSGKGSPSPEKPRAVTPSSPTGSSERMTRELKGIVGMARGR